MDIPYHPYPGEYGYKTWEDPQAWKHIGSANCWAGFSMDEKRGLLFIPTGSAAYDFYGGKRKGRGLFANCVLALNAATGKLVWHYQVIHHDMWDKDLPTAPILITVKQKGKAIDAVAQATKHGFIFVLDRTNGKPLFPVTENRVPTNSELKGEKTLANTTYTHFACSFYPAKIYLKKTLIHTFQPIQKRKC